MEFRFSSGAVRLDLAAAEGLRIKALRVGDSDFSWLNDGNFSGGFSIAYDGTVYHGSDCRFRFLRIKERDEGNGACTGEVIFEDVCKRLRIKVCFRTFREYAVLEQWVTVKNTGDAPVRIDRLDSFSFALNASLRELSYFIGNWGHEFTPVKETLDGRSLCLQSTLGRSAGNGAPLFHLGDGGERHVTGTLAWSGNWIFRFQPLNVTSYGSYTYELTGGIHDMNFFTVLEPGDSMDGSHMVMAFAEAGGMDGAGSELLQWGREYWYLKSNELARLLPVEWNHWWPYEDDLIDRQTFLANVDCAAEMGVELCTLDAGWFGPSGKDVSWVDYRGDWDRVNAERFPGGIAALSDYVHAKGMKFGLWCEIEAMGAKAGLNTREPGFAARRDGRAMGYLCFGSAEVQAWACTTLDRLIREYGCDWIKIDYNLDAGYGCNEPGHGHSGGDGLYAHYHGFYKVMDRVRELHPEVVFENCSSGGLRMDLEMMRHFHLHFLSDPDMPVHNLQLIWGFTTAFAPERALHFFWSDTKLENWEGYHPSDGSILPHQADFYIRTAMLNGFGISHKLPLLPPEVRERITRHISLYKEKIRENLKNSVVYHLTGQPLRTGKGEAWTVLQYRLPKEGKGMLFIFRLKGSEEQRLVRLKGLEEETAYEISDHDGGAVCRCIPGRSLMMEGLVLDGLREEEARIYFYSPAGSLSPGL